MEMEEREENNAKKKKNKKERSKQIQNQPQVRVIVFFVPLRACGLERFPIAMQFFEIFLVVISIIFTKLQFLEAF